MSILLLYLPSNNSKNKKELPDCIAKEYENIVFEVLERRGLDFVLFMRRVRARFNNPKNYFTVSNLGNFARCLLITVTFHTFRRT